MKVVSGWIVEVFNFRMFRCVSLENFCVTSIMLNMIAEASPSQSNDWSSNGFNWLCRAEPGGEPHKIVL